MNPLFLKVVSLSLSLQNSYTTECNVFYAYILEYSILLYTLAIIIGLGFITTKKI